MHLTYMLDVSESIFDIRRYTGWVQQKNSARYLAKIPSRKKANFAIVNGIEQAKEELHALTITG